MTYCPPVHVFAGSTELAAAQHLSGDPAMPAQFPAVRLPEPVAAAAAVGPVHDRAAAAARPAATAAAASPREHTQQICQVLECRLIW